MMILLCRTFRCSSSCRRRGAAEQLRSSAARARHGARGVTLIEMILVLAVLVAIAAMAWPAMKGPLDDQRLRKAADIIRAQWIHARVAAMKTGRVHVFRYQIGGDIYAVQPWYAETDAVEASSDPATATTAPVLNAGNQNSPLGVTGARLPPGITFYSGETLADARTRELNTDAAGTTMGSAWCQPIVFYPDGSTSDSRLVLTNQRCFVELTLRGLTGFSRGSDLLSIEELSP